MILVLTDSLGLPRRNPERCGFDKTWPELLRRDEIDLRQLSIGGATSSELRHQLVYYADIPFDAIVFQAGIVDCAPRFATKFEISFLRRLPIVGSAALGAMNRPSVRSLRRRVYVPEAAFRENVGRIHDTCRTVAVGIPWASEAYERLLPGVSDNIRRYNAVLTEVFGEDAIMFEPEKTPKLVMSDHHHLNPDGHAFVHRAVKARLRLLRQYEHSAVVE